MALVIKKIVDLSSIGDEYKGISLVFKSIPAKDLPEIDKKQSAVKQDDNGNPILSEVLPLFISILQEYYLEGTQGEDKIVKEDIGELDANALIHCFQILTGQDVDPKAENSSTSTSTTDQAPA